MDGAAAQTENLTMEILQEFFSDHIISQNM
jgi:hypothetical protein